MRLYTCLVQGPSEAAGAVRRQAKKGSRWPVSAYFLRASILVAQPIVHALAPPGTRTPNPQMKSSPGRQIRSVIFPAARARLRAGCIAMRNASLSDAQWAVLEPLRPAGQKPGCLPKWTRRQLIDGIRWRVRTGAPWRDVPPVYGHWQTVHGLFRRHQRVAPPRLMKQALVRQGLGPHLTSCRSRAPVRAPAGDALRRDLGHRGPGAAFRAWGVCCPRPRLIIKALPVTRTFTCRYSGSLTHRQPRDSSRTGRTTLATDGSPSWAMTRSS